MNITYDLTRYVNNPEVTEKVKIIAFFDTYRLKITKKIVVDCLKKFNRYWTDTYACGIRRGNIELFEHYVTIGSGVYLVNAST